MWPPPRPRSKASRSACRSSFYVDDLDADVAKILDNTVAVLKREGADIVKVDLPDQRQLASACQLVLAVEAAAFHKRWLIERPQDYGPQVLMRLQNGLAIPGVLYLETMRWRGQALSAHIAATSGVDAVLAPVAPLAAPTIAESDVGNGPDAEALLQRGDALHPPDQLSRPAVAGDPRRLHAKGLPVGMQLIGRSFDEATLLTIGAAFQRATDFHDKVPQAVSLTVSFGRLCRGVRVESEKRGLFEVVTSAVCR